MHQSHAAPHWKRYLATGARRLFGYRRDPLQKLFAISFAFTFALAYGLAELLRFLHHL